MQNILGLVDDHDALDDSARKLCKLTENPHPRPEEAFDALCAFRCTLNGHLSAEQEFLKGKDQPGRGEFATFAAAQEASFVDLVNEWETYLSEWSEENIREDWSSFARATRWIMGRLRAFMRMENDCLYPLALRHGLISLRPQEF